MSSNRTEDVRLQGIRVQNHSQTVVRAQAPVLPNSRTEDVRVQGITWPGGCIPRNHSQTIVRG